MPAEWEVDSIVKEIRDAFATNGHLDHGENISMQEHMLQAAWLAEQDGADERVVVATLLHDYGHLVCDLPRDTLVDGYDNHHESLGADALSNWFEEDIVNAVRLHVAAKRYLCGSNPGYRDELSDASKTTLEIQGGPMTGDELFAFRNLPGHDMAVQVRVYDDRGKINGMERPELDHYVPMIRRCLGGRPCGD